MSKEGVVKAPVSSLRMTNPFPGGAELFLTGSLRRDFREIRNDIWVEGAGKAMASTNHQSFGTFSCIFVHTCAIIVIPIHRFMRERGTME